MKKNASHGKADKSNEVHALSGLLVCADCGKKLKFKSNRGGNNCFYCRTYIDLGKKYCSSHCISEKEIERLVQRDIRAMLNIKEIDERKAKQLFIKNKAKNSVQSKFSDERQLRAYKSRLAELDRLIQSAFEEKVLNGMPESLYADLLDKYRKERSAVEREIAKTEKKLVDAGDDEKEVEEYMIKLKSYCNCESLTRETCLQLIDLITVGEKGEGGRNIHVYYKFTV